MRAEVDVNGQIQHIVHPPEIHGSPWGGVLTYWNHSWEFVETMKEVGFRDVKVHFYNDVYKGFFGVQCFITGSKQELH